MREQAVIPAYPRWVGRLPGKPSIASDASMLIVN